MTSLPQGQFNYSPLGEGDTMMAIALQKPTFSCRLRLSLRTTAPASLPSPSPQTWVLSETHLFKGRKIMNQNYIIPCYVTLYFIYIYISCTRYQGKESCCPIVFFYKINCLYLTTTNHLKPFALVILGLRQSLLFLLYTFLCWVNSASSEYIIFKFKKTKYL